MKNIKTTKALLLAVVLAGLGFGELQAQQHPPGEIFVVQASSRQPTVVIGGTVVPYKEVTLAAQVPGRVKFIAGIEGDAFSKDAVLVEIPFDRRVAEALSMVPRSEVPDLPYRIIAATAIYRDVPVISRDRKIQASRLKVIW